MSLRNIYIFFICIVIGLLLVLQIRLSEGQRLYVSAKAISDYETTIKQEREAIDATKLLIEQAKAKLLLYEGGSDQEGIETEELISQLESEREAYAMFSAAYTVQGPGVIIKIDDGVRDLYEGEDINNILVHDADILLIINDLKRNGAEAISVNGERLVANSSVICSGYTVEINGTRYARPFVIEAIGDGSRMISSLLGAAGYGTSLKNWGVLFDIELEESLTIPAFSQEPKYFYSKKAQEVEGL